MQLWTAGALHQGLHIYIYIFIYILVKYIVLYILYVCIHIYIYNTNMFTQPTWMRRANMSSISERSSLWVSLTKLGLDKLSRSTLPILRSMDWFCWENLQETHGFLPSNWSGFPVNFPIIQFYDEMFHRSNGRCHLPPNSPCPTCEKTPWSTNWTWSYPPWFSPKIDHPPRIDPTVWSCMIHMFASRTKHHQPDYEVRMLTYVNQPFPHLFSHLL